MGSAETAYQGSYDSYNVMSGGDLRVNSKDYVDLPNYARLQDGSRKPITLNMRGAEYIRSSNILKDIQQYPLMRDFEKTFELAALLNSHRVPLGSWRTNVATFSGTYHFSDRVAVSAKCGRVCKKCPKMTLITQIVQGGGLG